ncbi:MAG TPA: YfcE family phosphodiesterase [Anaerolinea thermolimosa]|uniref:Phosphoesterase n=1 Tax=Anaerolinea thermolimosa TaxID=229919 RepID=A0A3D1JIM0_9CHLR|nr:YfcE family phosphodiesterase [Anaerolinea thermolimosa]GAP05509.1 phosphoesterase, MJ0936 family [Anaerolinea thermolimosa]HCE18419.1 YfcE family phosphodiesterase [Anaerolinea thermolimosa]
MKIGIISDTHNHLHNLQVALERLRQEGAEVLIHCGDLTTPETASALGGFRVIHVCGNGDIATGAIRQALLQLNPSNYSGMIYRGEIEGLQIAAVHGHVSAALQELIRSQSVDLLFTGHTHRRRDEQIGKMRLINPGALGGVRVEERSFYLLDSQTHQGRFFYLA